jgi:hypothetical protein
VCNILFLTALVCADVYNDFCGTVCHYCFSLNLFLGLLRLVGRYFFVVVVVVVVHVGRAQFDWPSFTSLLFSDCIN